MEVCLPHDAAWHLAKLYVLWYFREPAAGHEGVVFCGAKLALVVDVHHKGSLGYLCLVLIQDGLFVFHLHSQVLVYYTLFQLLVFSLVLVYSLLSLTELLFVDFDDAWLFSVFVRVPFCQVHFVVDVVDVINVLR